MQRRGVATQFRINLDLLPLGAEFLCVLQQSLAALLKCGDFGAHRIEVTKRVARKVRDVRELREFTFKLSDIAPRLPDELHVLVPVKLFFEPALAALRINDRVLAASDLITQFRVPTARLGVRVQSVIDVVEPFVVLGQPTGSAIDVQNVRAAFADLVDQLQQTSAFEAHRQRIDVLGDVVGFERCQCLQLRQTDREDVFIDALGDIADEIANKRGAVGNRAFSVTIDAPRGHEPARAELADATHDPRFLVVPHLQRAAPRLTEIRPLEPLRIVIAEAVEHSANESHQRRLAGLVGTEEDADSVGINRQIEVLPCSVTFDMNPFEFHSGCLIFDFRFLIFDRRGMLSAFER